MLRWAERALLTEKSTQTAAAGPTIGPQDERVALRRANGFDKPVEERPPAVHANEPGKHPGTRQRSHSGQSIKLPWGLSLANAPEVHADWEAGKCQDLIRNRRGREGFWTILRLDRECHGGGYHTDQHQKKNSIVKAHVLLAQAETPQRQVCAAVKFQF